MICEYKKSEQSDKRNMHKCIADTSVREKKKNNLTELSISIHKQKTKLDDCED